METESMAEKDAAQIDSSRRAKSVFIFTTAAVVFVGIPVCLILGPTVLTVCGIGLVAVILAASFAAVHCLRGSQSGEQSGEQVGPVSISDFQQSVEPTMSVEPPEKPERPQKPPPPNSGNRNRSPLTIILAGVAAVFLAATFSLLALASIGPIGIAVMGVSVVIFAVAGLQYLLWGWWLGPAIRRDAEAERQRAEAEQQSE